MNDIKMQSAKQNIQKSIKQNRKKAKSIKPFLPKPNKSIYENILFNLYTFDEDLNSRSGEILTPQALGQTPLLRRNISKSNNSNNSIKEQNGPVQHHVEKGGGILR